MRNRCLLISSVVALAVALAACGDQWRQPQLNHAPADHPFVPAGTGAMVDRLIPLVTAWTRSNEASMFAGGDAKKPMDLPLPAFFIDHRGEYALVDTGLSPLLATDPAAYLGETLAKLGKSALKEVTIKAEWSAAARLQKLGVDRGQVGRVILTHAHFDHTGANRDFPHAAFLLTQPLWDAGRKGDLFSGHWRRDFPDSLRLQLIDFHGSAPFLTFAGRYDVFGDGSVIVLPMPGHDPGCVGVFVRARTRNVLLIGDAAYTMRNIRELTMPARAVDAEAEWDTLGRLRKLTEAAPDILIVPSHDAAVIRAIPNDPDSF